MDGTAGTPIGRRVFLGMLGVGAVGVLYGAKAQDWMERVLAPLTARDGTGLSTFLPVGRFRIYSVVGDPPHKSDAQYLLDVGGHVRQSQQAPLACRRAQPPTGRTYVSAAVH